jgi:hypothetical protein
MDSGSDMMICPREDVLQKVCTVHPLRVNTIAGHATTTKEGELVLNNRIRLHHVKMIKGAPFTIVSEGQIVDSGELVIVRTHLRSYVIPRKKLGIPDRTLETLSIFSAERKGKLYVFPIQAMEQNKEKQQFQVKPRRAHAIPRKGEMTAEARKVLMNARTERTAEKKTHGKDSQRTSAPMANAVTTRAALRSLPRADSPDPMATARRAEEETQVVPPQVKEDDSEDVSRYQREDDDRKYGQSSL